MGTWDRVTDEIEHFRTHIREVPVARPIAPIDVRAALGGRYDFGDPIPLGELTAEVMDLLTRWNVHVTHPRYFGLFNPSVHEAGIVAETLAALYNPQLAVWSHAPAANEIERLTLHHLCRALGFDPATSLANFTSGGAEANLSAVLAALARQFPESGEGGIGSVAARPAIYVTGESHHSFVKIARMTGLGTAALREVPTTDRFAMDPGGLARTIAADRRAGWSPLMVVATAGTTGAGIIDPLGAIADVAEHGDLWFHVDAAWGGGALLSPLLRPVLTGIERADSVTWDAHKWLSVPMGAGMFFCRHPDAVRRAFAVSTSYMPAETGEDTVDPYTATAQWSRRAIGLKVFMALAEQGSAGVSGHIEHQARMGDRLRESLTAAGWIVTNDTPLPVVTFSHPAIRAGRRTTGQILATVYARGRVWLSDVVLGEERVLRACITSFSTDSTDLACLMDELDHALGAHADASVDAPEAATLRLSDGAAIPVRPIRPTDAPALRSFHRALSPSASYHRYHGVVPELSDARARTSASVDGVDRFALVALEPGRRGGIIAMASFAREGTTDRAECAIAVADRWQRRGLGLGLARWLLVAARRRGIRTAWGLMLPDNAAMLRLVRRVEYPRQLAMDDGRVRVEFDLADARMMGA